MFGTRVLDPRQAHARGDHVIGVEARVDGQQTAEAPHQQTRTRQQHDGCGDLRDHQHSAQAPAARDVGRALVAALQMIAHGHARRVQRRRQTEREAGQQRHERREREDEGIESHVVQAREVRWAESDDGAEAGVGEEHAEHAAGAAQQNRFGQQLADDLTAAGAKRRANGHLALPVAALREQQVRDVDAGDQQHAGHDQHQQADRGAHASHHVFVQGLDEDAEVGVVVRIRLGELTRHDVEAPLRLGDRDARREPTHGAQPVRAPNVHQACERTRGRQWQPHVHLGGVIEARRHDADDGVGDRVEVNRSSEQCRVTAELAAPHAVAQDGHRLAARRELILREHASQDRTHANRIEEA